MATKATGHLFKVTSPQGIDYTIMKTVKKDNGTLLLGFRASDKCKAGKEQIIQLPLVDFESVSEAVVFLSQVMTDFSEGKVEDDKHARYNYMRGQLKKFKSKGLPTASD
eukprot:9457458-Pyramimonas_sp.AAC.1